jgi:hypothetical protein
MAVFGSALPMLYRLSHTDKGTNMRIQKAWFASTIIGISAIIAVWLITIFLGGWLSDAPGYPYSVIGAGAWLVLVSLGWSLVHLRSATGYRRIPRIMSVMAALLLTVGMLLSSLNLLAQSPTQPTPYPVPFWLFPLMLILMLIANLVESGWGKTNVRAWLRVIGVALVGATLLLGFLIAWVVVYR